MQCQLIRDLAYDDTAPKHLRGQPAPAGSVIEGADCWQIVTAGHAVPHDAECAERVWRDQFPSVPIAKAGLTDEQLATLRTHVDKLIRSGAAVARGIHPDDYKDFYAGRMTGYDPETGEPIPGDNAEYSGPLILS